MRLWALSAELIATAALVHAVLERRAPGRFPLADLLRDTFAPAGVGQPRVRALGGALLAGLALALVPLLGDRLCGWTTFEPTRALAWAWLLPAAATLAVKFLWAACEELIFRGALCTLLARRLGAALALLLSALVFALAHAPRTAAAGAGGWALLVRALDGVTYGLLFLGTGSLWAPVLAHAAKNTGIWLVTSASSLQFAAGVWRTHDRGPVLWLGTEHGAGLMEVLVAALVLSVVAVTAGRRVRRRPAVQPQAPRLQNALK
jgi:membrane protease YdiL (CAAX protease family)